MTLPERHLHLATIPNVRDLGGYRTVDGRVVRRGRVFRAGSLRDLGSEDADVLARQLGLRVFFDLRADDEVTAGDGGARLAELGVLWARTPLSGVSGEFLSLATPTLEDYVRNYLHILSSIAPVLNRVFGALADGASLPLAFGCTLGKDRTGVVAAVLLGALGVSEHVISADYEASGCCLVAHSERLGWLVAAKRVSPEEFRRRITLPAATMRRFLDELARDHGGPRGLLAAIGISEATLAEVGRNLLVSSDAIDAA